jgi:hypothetical protein
MDMYEMSCYKVNPNKYDLAHKGFWLGFTTPKIFFKVPICLNF